MSDVKTVLELGVGRATPPPDGFERMLRRRDRQRRNQRIAAGALGIAVFVAAIWIVTSGLPADRGSTPAGTGPAVTGPVVMPDYPGQVGLVGLAPEGLPPSTPARGELVLSFFFAHTGGDPGRFGLDLYRDGRLIWHKLGEGYAGRDEPATGLVEQRLTPEGVELIRSEVLSTGLFGHDLHLTSPYDLHVGDVRVWAGEGSVSVTWGDIGPYEGPLTAMTAEQADTLNRLDARLEALGSWLPASAWEDQQMRPFVPSRYSFCLETGQDVGLGRVLASLPRRAEDLVRGWDLTYREDSYSEGWFWCSAVTADRARALAGVLDDAGVQSNGGDVFGLVYDSGPANGSALNVSISFEPAMPNWP